MIPFARFWILNNFFEQMDLANLDFSFTFGLLAGFVNLFWFSAQQAKMWLGAPLFIFGMIGCFVRICAFGVFGLNDAFGAI